MQNKQVTELNKAFPVMSQCITRCCEDVFVYDSILDAVVTFTLSVLFYDLFC